MEMPKQYFLFIWYMVCIPFVIAVSFSFHVYLAEKLPDFKLYM